MMSMSAIEESVLISQASRCSSADYASTPRERDDPGLQGLVSRIHQKLHRLADGQARIEAILVEMRGGAHFFDAPTPGSLTLARVGSKRSGSDEEGDETGRSIMQARSVRSVHSLNSHSSSMESEGQRRRRPTRNVMRRPTQIKPSNSSEQLLVPLIEHSSMSLPKDWPSCLELRPFLNVALEFPDEPDPLAATSLTPSAYGWSHRLGKTRHRFLRQQHSAVRGPEVNRCMLAPNSFARFVFDIAGVLFLLYDLLVMPCVMAWDVEFEEWLLIMSIVSLIYWIADMLASFRTAHVNHNGEIETRPEVVCKRYLQSWFLPDLVIVLIDIVSTTVLAYTSYGSRTLEDKDLLLLTKLCRFFRVVRMLRITRLHHLARSIADFSPSLDLHLKIFSHLFTIVYVNHLMACIWYGVGKAAFTDTGLHWLDISRGPESGDTYRESPGPYQYTTSLHWAVTQMTPGSMQVNPLNTMERIYNVLCLLLGMIFFSHTISMLSSKMTSIKIAEQHKEKQLHTLRRFLRQNNIPTSLGVQIHKEANERMTAGKKVLQISDIEILDLVSLPLRTKLRQELCGRHLLNHPLFQLCARVDDIVIQNMSMKAEPTILAPGDSLFLPGTPGVAAYLNTSGQSYYTQEILPGNSNEDPRRPLTEQKWVCEVVLWVMWMHVGTTVAETHSTFISLEAAHFGDLLKSHTVWVEFVRDYGRLFHERVVCARPPAADWPNDLEVDGASYGEILVSMPAECRKLSGEIGLAELAEGRVFLERDFFLLQDDVRCGKSTLMVTGQGVVERVVGVVILSIEDEDGRILVQIGEEKDGVATPCVPVRLPGLRVQESMLALDCALHIINDRLSRLAPSLVMQHLPVRYSENKTSETRGIQTTYILTKFQVALVGPTALLEVPLATKEMSALSGVGADSMTANASGGSSTDTADFLLHRHVMYMPDSKGRHFFYAWMSAKELSHYRSGSSDSRHILGKVFESLRYDRSSAIHSLSTRSPTLPVGAIEKEPRSGRAEVSPPGSANISGIVECLSSSEGMMRHTTDVWSEEV